MSHPHSTAFGMRLEAWALAHLMSGYERWIAARKRALFADLAGAVVEIGPGAGANLCHMPTAVRWIGVEPNPYAREAIAARARRLGRAVEVRDAAAERIDAPDASADAVVCTLVMCSVQDQSASLQEILRVLKPGGRFLFIEHVAAPRGSILRAEQRLIRPVWRRVAGGCEPDRETWAAIERAGFARVTYERFRVPAPIFGPHIAGTAVKASATPR